MYKPGSAYLDLISLGCPTDDLSLTDDDFYHRYQITKTDMLSSCELYFFVRKTTRKAGEDRGMFVGGNDGVAKARTYTNLWGPVPWTVTTSPKRWIRTNPSGYDTDRPQVVNNQQLIFPDNNGHTHSANIRWQTTGEYMVPKGKFFDHDCEFITTAPAFRNANMKFAGKTKLKTGAGFLVKAAEAYYDTNEYDNHRYNNLPDLQGKPQDFYIPIQYARPKAVPPIAKATGITLNYPIHGFLLTLEMDAQLPMTYVPPTMPNPYLEMMYDKYYPNINK